MILSCMNMLLLFVLIPVFSGMLFYKSGHKIIISYIYGWMLMLAVFEMLAVPAVFLRESFQRLTMLWMAVIAVLGIFGLYRNRTVFSELRKIKIKWKPEKVLFWGLCFVQILLVVVLCHSDADDNYFIGIANTSLSTDTLFCFDAYTGQPAAAFPLRYVFSPFPVFWGSISKLTGIHPAILAHTVFPVILILLAYLIIYELGFRIFRDSQKSLMFCNIMAFMNFFGNYSIYTTSTFLLFRIWQGKAMVANIILPLLVFWFLNEEERGMKEFLVLLVIVVAGCGVSSMGIVLQLLLLFAYGVVYVFRKRWKWALQVFLASLPCFALSLAYIIACGR